MATDLALMEAPAATFSPRNRSDEFVEEEKAKSVETLAAAASPATDAAVEDGDTAPSTLIQLAAESVAECDKPEPPLGQEASGSAREEEDAKDKKKEETSCLLQLSSSQEEPMDQEASSCNSPAACLPTPPNSTAVTEQLKDVSKSSPRQSLDADEPSKTVFEDEEKMDTSAEVYLDGSAQTSSIVSPQTAHTQDGHSPSSTSQKGAPRNQRFESIIRTRRTSSIDQTSPATTTTAVSGDNTSGKRKSRDRDHASPLAKLVLLDDHAAQDSRSPSPSSLPPQSPTQTDSDVEDKKAEMSKRGKLRGKGRSKGPTRNPKKTQTSSDTSAARSKHLSPATEGVILSSRGRGKGRTRASTTQAQSPMTRAAAAGLQTVQFLSLPGKKAKKRPHDQGSEEALDEEEEDEDEEDNEEEEESPVKSQPKKPRLEEQSEEKPASNQGGSTKPASKQAETTSAGKGKPGKTKDKDKSNVEEMVEDACKESDGVPVDDQKEACEDMEEETAAGKNPKSPLKQLPRRGGRRGRRGGRGGSTSASRGSRQDNSPTVAEKKGEKDADLTEQKNVCSPQQPPTRGKRRGRPPKKKSEVLSSSEEKPGDKKQFASQAASHSEDTQKSGKSARANVSEGAEKDKSQDSANGSTEKESSASCIPSILPTLTKPSKKGQEADGDGCKGSSSDAVKTNKEKETESATNDEKEKASKDGDVKPAATSDPLIKPSSVIVSVLSSSKSSTVNSNVETPPTTSVAAAGQPTVPPHPPTAEGGYPYHPFSMEDMHSMAPPPHFIPPYPPFSAPPYGSFMVPSSPSYPYPPPPEHYHMYPGYHQDELPYGFPPHPPHHHPVTVPSHSSSSSASTLPPSSTSSSWPSATTASNSDTSSAPAKDSESSGGEQTTQKTSPSTPSAPPPGPSPTTPHAMEVPLCHYAHPSPITSGFIPGPYGLMWNMPQRPPMLQSPPTTIKPPTSSNEPRFPLNLFHEDQRSSQPVDCPECGRHFKNNKALNGHMRLHGGFDWTRKPYQAIQQMQQQQQKKEQVGKEQSQPTGASSSSQVSSSPSDNFVREQIKHHVREKHHDDTSSKQGGGRDGEGAKKKEKDKKQASVSTVNKTATTNRKHSKDKDVPSSLASEDSEVKESMERNRGTPATPPQPVFHSATLDDLCRAAEELERIDRQDLEQTTSKKHRPGNILIPSHSSPLLHHHDRQKLASFSPPYTPPPILSPSRSMTLLNNVSATPQSGVPCTPNKIWQRKGSERVSESEESFSYTEPKINVGKEFQAELPKHTPESPAHSAKDDVHKAVRVWQPLEGLTQEEEDTVDGFLELACSPAMPNAGRNKELALHTLYQTKGSIKEAVRLLVTGKSVVSRNDCMATYNYTGSKRWTGRERQAFRHAWRVHRKRFPLIRSAVENKQLSEVVEYYYSWKKYCNDEYRGRNRHVSEEILSEEDEVSGRPPSAASTSGSSASGETDQQTQPFNSTSTASTSRFSSSRSLLQSSPSSISLPTEVMEHLPRAYIPSHVLNPPVQEHHCKYPGCNQVYTSIFALNGHIRVHGGSWYPKKTDVENSSSDNSSSSSVFGSGALRTKLEERHSSHQLEVAKTMVMDLPQPRSPAHILVQHTPSPKASPGRAKSTLVRSRKACSSSPADRDGYYPCNRCGRVFTKVKSRSAHMKSHIVKQS